MRVRMSRRPERPAAMNSAEDRVSRSSARLTSSEGTRRRSAAKSSESVARPATPSKVSDVRSVDAALAFDRKGQYQARRLALLAEAARQFNENGEGKFSLTEVARSLNITKTALYYYFK